MELKVLNTLGEEVGVIAVSDALFGAEYNAPLIHQVVVAQLANRRQGTKSALTRTEVRGGGVKPWRQKGTGRARQGSIRAPQWKHGGVVFAPKPRDFSKKINKKMNTAAMASALSQKVRQNELFVLENIELSDAKTRLMAEVCGKLNAGKKALFVLGSENEKVVRATRNLPTTEVRAAELLNVTEVVGSNKIFLTVEAVKKLEELKKVEEVNA